MRVIKSNKNLILIFTILLFVLNIYFIRKADILAQQGALLKKKITSLNKDALKFKPWVTQRNFENFIEGKKVPLSVLINPVYKNHFSSESKANKLSVVLVATSVDCSSCTEEEIEMWKEFLNHNMSSGIESFSIYHNNTEESLIKFKENYQNLFPVISDPEFLFKRELNIQRTPIILILNNQNRIMYAHIPVSEDKEKTKNFIRKIERIL